MGRYQRLLTRVHRPATEARRKQGPVQHGFLSSNEDGASLILALVFLVVVSLIVISMATWTSNDLRNSIKFTRAQSTVATANSATEVAVQSVRYDFEPATLNASPPAACLASPFPTLNDQTVSVWCSTQWNQTSASTRRVTFSTCLSTVSAADCAVHPLLQAIVTYDDFPTSGNYSSCGPVSTSTTTTAPMTGSSCGTGMKINTWVFGPTPPTVTAVLPNTGTAACSSTLPITITGTGFASPATVAFVVSASSSFFATNVTVASTTTIYACEPTGGAGSGTVNVVVSTPTGTSPISAPADQVSY